MNILTVDTTDSALIVALDVHGKRYDYTAISQSKKHNATLLPSVENLLLQASIELKDLDALACVCGPGSFTGIRLGVSTINGLARGLSKPIISLNALEVIAYGSHGITLALVDANHGNYYGGIYNDNLCVAQDNYTLEQVDAFVGNKIARDSSYLNKLFTLAQVKYNSASFCDKLTPMYMKLSQAERELNGNN